MKTFILTVAATALLLTPNFTIAEEPAGGKPPGQRPHGGPDDKRMDPEQRLKMMTEKLGLTTEQQEKIKAVFEKGKAEREALKPAGEKPTEEEREKIRASMKAHREEIDAILTPEQREKMKEMREKRKDERGGRGPGGERGERKPKKDGEEAPAN